MNKLIIVVIACCTIISSLKAQDGFYLGATFDMFSAREEILSSDGVYNFSHSTKSSNNGLLTQNLGDYGLGIQLGYEKIFGSIEGKGFSLGVQYFFNSQNLKLESRIDGLIIKTIANYNHGWRLTYGYHFGRIHPYMLIQGTFQTVTPSINVIENEGVYDVSDSKMILNSKLVDAGDKFTTFSAAFLGGFGIEFPVNNYLVIDINYVPLKHVEYGLRDVNNEDKYFVNGLAINNLQLGIKMYPIQD